MDQCDNSVQEGKPPQVSAMGRVRHLLESLIFLALAVILIRAFQLEGYLISTGSMANSLLGYHKRVTCPECERLFAVGTSFDESQPVAGRDAGKAPDLVTCPNCGLPHIDIRKVPTTQGDQILIHKEAFLFRNPRRGEVAVFRNPAHGSQVYLKRVMGLPGEEVQLKEGDLFINHERVQKNWEEQKAVRELVHDARFSKSSETLKPRWVASRDENQWSWSAEEKSWHFSVKESAPPTNYDWLQYQHWWKSGGNHRTAIVIPKPEQTDEEFAEQLRNELKKNPEETSEPDPLRQLESPIRFPQGGCPVDFDHATRELFIYGVLTDEWYEKIQRLNPEPDKQQVLKQLRQRSHLGPISDFNSYNPPELNMQIEAVRDLAVELNVKPEQNAGQFVTAIHDGTIEYQLELNFETNEVRLSLGEEGATALSGFLPELQKKTGYEIQFTTFDRQVLVMINGMEMFEPWSMPFLNPDQPYPRLPIRMGGRGGEMKISNLRVYRDLHYRSNVPEPVLHAASKPYKLGDDEFFVLGDNSMVSWDSRCWEDPVVPLKNLVGRPLIVHLPSRPGVFMINERELPIRIPDIARVRLIH